MSDPELCPLLRFVGAMAEFKKATGKAPGRMVCDWRAARLLRDDVAGAASSASLVADRTLTGDGPWIGVLFGVEVVEAPDEWRLPRNYMEPLP